MSTPPYSDLLLDTLALRREDDRVYSFEEEFNPEVLDAFYTNPTANAFMAQIEFFNGRLKRQHRIEGCKGIVVEDRTLHEDYHIFGRAQKVLGNMRQPEFLAYQRTFELMTHTIPEPDLIVYLEADLKTLQERLQERGRESEKRIEEGYLSLLNDLYEQFIQLKVRCPVLRIDATQDLPLRDYLDNTIRAIRNRIKELKLRVTTPGIGEWVTLPQTQATLRAIDAETRLERYLTAHPTIISVAGNVGLGKSTLSAIMERSLKIQGLYENPDDNPLLEKFLADKQRYCYDLQCYFLNYRAKQQKEAKASGRSHVIDRSIPEDLLVFSQQFQKDGHLSWDQLDCLFASFKTVCDTIPSADLMIVLRGSADLSWKRILQRGREMEIEGGWTKAEIEALSGWYENYSRNVVSFGYHSGIVLELNVEKLDFTNRIHVGYIYDTIYKALTAERA